MTDRATPGVELYKLNSCDWTLEYSQLVQLTNFGETYTIKVPFYLVDHPEGTVLFDTGVSYEMKTDPENYGPFGAAHMADFVGAIDMPESQTTRYQLEDLGYSSDDIDYVVLSHLHVDHAGNVADFPGAEFLVQKEELRYASWADPIQQPFYLEGDFGALRSPAFDVTTLEGRCDVFGDGTVTTIPTPGHTPGHQSLKVRLEDAGTVILAADLAHLRPGYENELGTAFDWSLERGVESKRTIREEAQGENAEVVILHDRDDFLKLPDAPEPLT